MSMNYFLNILTLIFNTLLCYLQCQCSKWCWWESISHKGGCQVDHRVDAYFSDMGCHWVNGCSMQHCTAHIACDGDWGGSDNKSLCLCI